MRVQRCVCEGAQVCVCMRMHRCVCEGAGVSEGAEVCE